MASSAPPPTSSITGFSKLPGEIRNEIYRLLFVVRGNGEPDERIHIIKYGNKGRGVPMMEEHDKCDEIEQTDEKRRGSYLFSNDEVIYYVSGYNLYTGEDWDEEEHFDPSKNKSSLTTTSKLGFPLALLRTRKSIADEATAVLYSENFFCIEDIRTWSFPESLTWYFAKEIGTSNAARIKEFTLAGNDNSVLSVPRLQQLLNTFPGLKRATLGGLTGMWRGGDKRSPNTPKFLEFAKRLLSTHGTLRHVASKQRGGDNFLIFVSSGGKIYEELDITFLADEKDCRKEDGTLFDVDEAIRGFNEDDRGAPS